MSLNLSKPHYPFEPIRSITALSRALGFDVSVLEAAARSANQSYRQVKPEPGSTRITFDALGRLKEIHRRIKDRILSNVHYPDYLQGSLKGRDYVTNARLHTNKKILICEDVKKFFPSVKSEKVRDIWSGVLGFSSDVSSLLTALTTKDGALPQGAITSSYLANLALWRDEPLLQAKLAKMGVTYSRYVDDICMSAAHPLDKQTQTRLISSVYGMLRRNELSAGRRKHQVFTANRQMVATKLIVNNKPSLTKKKRSQLRAQVHHLELMLQAGEIRDVVTEKANNASQSIGQLQRFHPVEAAKLKRRTQAVREKANEQL